MQQDQLSAAEETLHKDPGAAPSSGALGRMINMIGVVFAIGILCSALILFLEVLLRYVFNSPTIWAHETVIFLNASAFLFGGLYVAARDAHIRVVIFYDNLRPKLRRWFDVVIPSACAISTAFFAWAAWQSVKKAAWTPQGDFRLETSGSAWNPPTPGMLKIFLLVVLIVMTVQFALIAINHLRGRH